MGKIEWGYIVTGCKSNARVPAHFFPKDSALSHRWKLAINNEIISTISLEDLRKYRVCHVHFA